MVGFAHTTAHGQLTRADLDTAINLMDRAWRCTNLLEVESLAARGSSVHIPTRPGRVSRRRFRDELSVHLEMVVQSGCTPAGVVFTEASRAGQLAANLRALSPVASLPEDPDGGVWEYTANDGAAYTGRGWVEGWDVAPLGLTMASVGFTLVIPDGVWMPVP